MALSLHATPLSLKAVVASYILSLAVFIPISGWLADRFGTRRIFGAAVMVFTIASVLCGISTSVPMLVLARLLQGVGGAMMIPVGRLAIVRTFPKSQLLTAMNFVIIPALIGPLLGPTVGGLVVHLLSWRDIFFINVPIGLFALYMIYRHMPDYYGETNQPLDKVGFVLFGVGIALLSWLLEIFGESRFAISELIILFVISILFLVAYVWHSGRMSAPLLKLSLFKIRTFRISIVGGFVTSLGIGGMPFLLPLLYQVGLGMPAWKSGVLMMPAALAAMSMKYVSKNMLQRFGYRQVLIVNTIMIGISIVSFSLINPNSSAALIVVLGLCQGLFNSLQFSSMSSMVYADVPDNQVSMASTISSSFQQISMSFGLAMGSLTAGWFLHGLPQTNQVAVTTAIHHALWVLGALTILSSLTFWGLHAHDGDSVSRGQQQ
ncbi:MAG: transporter [Burkholderiaceae bacterium]|nr:transporter [Burkholderiaceae bacterium]